MTATDELLANNEEYPEWAAESFSDPEPDVRQSIARIKASPFVPRKGSVRSFIYEVETGRPREVL